MKRVALPLFLTLFAVLLSAAPLKAQWSGEVDGSGGYGATKSLRNIFWEKEDKYLDHFLGQGRVRVSFDKPRFHWGASLQGQYESKQTDNFHFAAKASDKEEDVDVSYIVKMNEEKPLSLKFMTDAYFRPSPAGLWSFWLNYDFNYRSATNLTYKTSMQNYSEDLTQETPFTLEQILSAGLQASYELGSSRRVLTGTFSVLHSNKEQETDWFMVGGIEGEEEEETEAWLSSFRMTPSSSVVTYSGNLHLRDSLMTGAPRWVLDPGVRYSVSKALHSNSGATLDLEHTDLNHMVWIDSTAIRESFHFASIDLQPHVATGFEWKNLRVNADYALSFYARQLADSTHHQGFKWQSPLIIGNGSIAWQITPRHLVSFFNSLSVKHPTYLQICWFDRSGGYMEQLYRGSESLRSTKSRLYRTQYTFRYRRFLASGSASFTFQRDEIEQTWFNEVIDNRTYKVFSWLNGADSHIIGGALRLGWLGKVMTANLGVESNHTTRTHRETGEVKQSDDWRLTADAAAHFSRGWTLSGDMRYQSKVSTFFSIFKQYCVLNARIQKDFKKVSLFLEGRDLLDRPMETKFISADEKEVWTESTLHNRRLLRLGCNWRF